MGLFAADITLKNIGDVINVGRGYIDASAVREMPVEALVDSGAETLVITEQVREQLGLKISHRKSGTLADGNTQMYNITEPVEVHWKDRHTVCEAYVVPGGHVLLGAIPMEGMDLMINMLDQRLVGRHGDIPIGMLC